MNLISIESIKRITLTLLLLILFLLNNTFGQISSKLGFDLGLVTSTPQKFMSVYGSSYKAPGLISPVAGIIWQIILSNRFELISGVQYEMFGTCFHKSDFIEHKMIGYDYSEKITLHKLCMPITLELTLNKKKYPIFFIGIRPNTLLTGKYFCERLDPVGQGFIHQYSYNILQYQIAYKRPNRFMNQYTIGSSKDFGQKYRITISCNFGGRIEFSKLDFIPYERRLKNNELAVSLTYFLIHEKKI